MNFEWTEVQRAWREKGKALARELPEDQSHITLLAAEYDMGKHFSITLPHE